MFPGGSREWDWTETGTRHTPGIQPEDVKELLEHGAKVLILSTGINQRLNICSETEHFLNHKNIPYYTLQTEKAVCKYNELRKYEAVAILIHSTC